MTGYAAVMWDGPMSFHTGKYDTFVMLGDPKAKPLWNWDVWSKLVPSIDALIQTARSKNAALRCDQFQTNGKSVKFGKIGWSEDGHKKWTHGSPATKDGDPWRFFSVQLWAPIWTVCEREDLAPDLFLEIVNEGYHEPEPSFSPVILLAASESLGKRAASAVKRAVSELARLAKSQLIGYRRRPWGMSVGDFGFTDSIQDLCTTGLFKPGPRRKVSFALFAKKWTPIGRVKSGLSLPSLVS